MKVYRDVREVEIHDDLAIVVKLGDGTKIVVEPSYYDEIIECRDLPSFWFYDCVEENLRLRIQRRKVRK